MTVKESLFIFQHYLKRCILSLKTAKGLRLMKERSGLDAITPHANRTLWISWAPAGLRVKIRSCTLNHFASLHCLFFCTLKNVMCKVLFPIFPIEQDARACQRTKARLLLFRRTPELKKKARWWLFHRTRPEFLFFREPHKYRVRYVREHLLLTASKARVCGSQRQSNVSLVPVHPKLLTSLGQETHSGRVMFQRFRQEEKELRG